MKTHNPADQNLKILLDDSSKNSGMVLQKPAVYAIIEVAMSYTERGVLG